MPTPRSVFFAAVLAVVSLIRPTMAIGQPVFDDLPTLEWRTAQADLVLTATIASVSVASDEWGASMVTLELSPVEVFKGRAPSGLLATMPNSRFHRSVAEGLTERMEAGHADLWFLTKQSDGSAYTPIDERIFTAFIPLLDPPIAEEQRSWLRRPLPPAVTMDLVRHDGKEAVLDALRRIVKNEPPHAESRTPPWGHRLQLSSISDLRLWPECESWYHPIVPADARLEALARRMIERPASFLEPLPESASANDRRSRGFDESSIRREGARALAIHFESPENAELLATLLDDTSTGLYAPSGLGEPTRHLFTTRRIAFDALTEWGFEAPAPEFEAPLPDPALAPSPAAIGAAHGPRGDWYDISEFFIELNGDSNPELLRLYLIRDKYGDTDYDLERFRTQGAMCWAFTLFSFHEGEPAMAFHRGNSLEGFALSLREHDGRPMLFTKQPHEWTTRSAFGWWPMWGSIEHAHWSARTGDWDGEARTFSPTGEAPLVRFDHSK